MKTYEIETERLILRNYKESDFNDFWDYVSQPNVGPRTGGWPPYTEKEKARERLLNVDCKNLLQFAVYYKEDKKVIGSVEIMEPKQERYPDIEIGKNTKEIGYLLSENYWSRGIMTEAVRAIVCFAFSVLKLDKIVIGHDVKNIGSGRVQEKVGFRFVKQSDEIHTWLGGESHLIEREMTREDYLKMKELQTLKPTLKIREINITENMN